MKKGQVIGIIEAMKLMNEIEAGEDGIVEEILVENEQLVNWFFNRNPQKMYDEVEVILQEMEDAGAEINMMFIHWGNEYELTENNFQNQQAQAQQPEKAKKPQQSPKAPAEGAGQGCEGKKSGGRPRWHKRGPRKPGGGNKPAGE